MVEQNGTDGTAGTDAPPVTPTAVVETTATETTATTEDQAGGQAQTSEAKTEPVAESPKFPHALNRSIAEIPESELIAAIKVFLEGRDLSQTPCFMVSHELFPSQPVHPRFQRAFFAALPKDDKAE